MKSIMIPGLSHVRAFAALCLAAAGLCLALTVQAGPSKSTVPATGKAQAEAPVIEGLEIARANGSYLGLRVVNGSWLLSFYDQEKKPVAVDVAMATTRWLPVNRKGREFCALNPGAEKSCLYGNRPVKPPYGFQLSLTLLDAKGEVVESFSVKFQE